MRKVITIDGQSASGKSSVANLLALHYGWNHIDCGKIFRIIAYVTMQRSIPHFSINLDAILDAVNSTETSEEGDIQYNGKDITKRINSESIGLLAAEIGRLENIQNSFVQFIRMLVDQSNSDCIVSGRIGGSIIFPEAILKFSLQADIAVRVERRLMQSNIISGSVVDVEKITTSFRKRDDIKNIMSYWDIDIPPEIIRLDTSENTLADVYLALREIIDVKLKEINSSPL